MGGPDGPVADPLVGRTAELERVSAALDAVGKGATRMLVITGEPGIGKSRLLAELAAEAARRGMLTLTGRAAEFEGDLPHGLLIDALDRYLSAVEPRLRRAVGDDSARELAAMFPALAGLAQPGAALATERYRAHRAVVALLDWMGVKGPLALLLDDVQWADPATREVLAALMRRPPRGPVLLVLAYRHARPPLAQAVEAAQRAGGLERLELAALAPAEAEALIGPAVSGAARSMLIRDSGGNPFYLQQLLRAPARAPAHGRADDVVIPQAVADALAGELDALRPTARLLLEGAAVAGEPFDPELAAAAADVPIADALAALDELLVADLVRPGDPRRFVFRHPLVRRAVYAGAGGGWRLAAHGRVSDALARRGAAATLRAHHLEYSAQPGDEEGIAVLVDAGRAAAQRAPATAARWFAAAVRLLPAHDERRLALLEQLAAARSAAGALDEARGTLVEALESVPEDDAAARCRLVAACARTEHWLGMHEEARRRLRAEVRRIEHVDSAEALALRIELAFDALYGLDLATSRTLAAEALAAAEASSDSGLAATAGALLALAGAAAGVVAEAEPQLDAALARVEALEPAQLARRLEALWYLAWAETFLERYEGALAHTRQALEISRATGQERLVVPLLLAGVFPLQMLGRMRESREVASAAVEAARLLGNRHFLLWALWEYAADVAYGGDLAEARVAARESAELAAGVDRSVLWECEPEWVVGGILAFDGQPEAGMALMLEAFGGPELPRVVAPERCIAYEELVETALDLGDLAGADAYASAAERHAAALGKPHSHALALRARAAVELARGDAAAAVASARESIAEAARARAPLEGERTRWLLGRALAAAGDRDAAVRELRAAEANLGTYGAGLHRDRVVRALRELGERARRPARAAEPAAAGTEALTKREREVAELVASGATNREIADALVLSVKTVETHIAHIFAKLDVRSRAALTATLMRG